MVECVQINFGFSRLCVGFGRWGVWSERKILMRYLPRVGGLGVPEGSSSPSAPYPPTEAQPLQNKSGSLKLSFLESFCTIFQEVLPRKIWNLENFWYNQRVPPISWQRYVGPSPRSRTIPIYSTVMVCLSES